MPIESKDAVTWAIQQSITTSLGVTYSVTKDTNSELVDKVREYFNKNRITYATFSYDDLLPYLD